MGESYNRNAAYEPDTDATAVEGLRTEVGKDEEEKKKMKDEKPPMVSIKSMVSWSMSGRLTGSVSGCIDGGRGGGGVNMSNVDIYKHTCKSIGKWGAMLS